MRKRLSSMPTSIDNLHTSPEGLSKGDIVGASFRGGRFSVNADGTFNKAQTKVYVLGALGETIPRTALILGVPEETVKDQRLQIWRILGIRAMPKAVNYGFKNAILEVEKPAVVDFKHLREPDIELWHAMSEGGSSSEVSALLDVPVPTVHKREYNLYGRLGVTNKAAAVLLHNMVEFPTDH